MSKSTVVLSGSPRKDGNTDRLVAAFIAGAESAGKSVTVFRVADMSISGCRGCNYCRGANGVCIQKDDMPQILDALKQADALILASPIYYFSVTAQLKLAIDRTYALNSVGTPIKKTALLVTCGDSSAKAAEGAVTTYNAIRSYYKWEDAGIIVAAGLHKPGEIDSRVESEKARALGQEI